jgi:hypothetical protein
MSDKPRERSASYLSPPDFHRLNWACQPIRAAFRPFGVFLVGSVTRRPDFRDIDLRIIVPDEQYEVLCPAFATKLLLDIAVSDLVAKAASLPWPIDLQFQSFTEAQEYADELRNPMGLIR